MAVRNRAQVPAASQPGSKRLVFLLLVMISGDWVMYLVVYNTVRVEM